ncbi:hypothetical protein IE53DRAFT_323334 [Violaceomyces palustris]|uniref:Uncharacterized protein n=1 Tax=Violaceomyces palustris TaxID=1673888 RepID=A0ACD0P841_9BASI|nr:hypothetical protein IE53DRAFT_323334 [Violaceomyces palustris]
MASKDGQHLLPQYLSIPDERRLTDRRAIESVLSSILAASPDCLSVTEPSVREDFISNLIRDLGRGTGKRLETDRLGRNASGWSEKCRLDALKILKEATRLPNGTAPMAKTDSLQIFLQQLEFSERPSQRTSSDSATLVSQDEAGAPPPQSIFMSSLKLGGQQSSVGNSSARSIFSTSLRRTKAKSIKSGRWASSTKEAVTPNWDITDASLRCLNNILFLNESTRSEFVSSEALKGGEVIADLLSDPWRTPAEIIFLSSRLLFFTTLFEAPFNKLVVEDHDIVPSIAACTYALLRDLLAAEGHTHASTKDVGTGKGPKQTSLSRPVTATTAQLKGALSELLKAFFNLGLYYPRLSKNDPGPSSAAQSSLHEKAILGEGYHSALQDVLLPTLQVVTWSPLDPRVPLSPPITNAIAVLLNFPIPQYRELWFKASELPQTFTGDESKVSRPWLLPRSRSQRSNHSNRSEKSGGGGGNGGEGGGNRLSKAVGAFLQQIQNGGSVPRAEQKEGRQVPLSSSSPTSTTSEEVRLEAQISPSSTQALSSCPRFVAKLLVLAEAMLKRYLSMAPDQGTTVEDPDDKAVKGLAERDGIDLEDTLQPLILLLRKVAAEDDGMKIKLRQIILPEDISRSRPIDKRLDLTGRLVRLMSSILLPRLARASGELLLAICNADPKLMTDLIGYGPCAGFLMSVNLASALPGASHSGTASGSSRTINPITGCFDPTEEEEQEDNHFSNLSQEEKEAEAEKLIGLFDRMNRTGVISVKNPLEVAAESGRFEEIEQKAEEEERRAREEEEKEDELIVEREMEKRKKRAEEARRRAQALVAGGGESK